MKAWTALFVLCLASACAAPAAESAMGTGTLHPRIVKSAAEYAGVERLKIRTDSSGAVTKLALYHRDAMRVPPAVRALADEKFPGATVRYYELELYADAGWVHEVEVETPDGRRCEVSASEDGSLRYVECELAPGELAETITTAVAELLPGGEVVEAETKKGPAVDVVHVEVKVGTVEHYLRFSSGGELLGHWVRVPAVVDIAVP